LSSFKRFNFWSQLKGFSHWAALIFEGFQLLPFFKYRRVLKAFNHG
jgi:hypothetical protein